MRRNSPGSTGSNEVEKAGVPVMDMEYSAEWYRDESPLSRDGTEAFLIREASCTPLSDKTGWYRG